MLRKWAGRVLYETLFGSFLILYPQYISLSFTNIVEHNTAVAVSLPMLPFTFYDHLVFVEYVVRNTPLSIEI